MGALPSQKYEEVLIAFMEWYNARQVSVADGIMKEDVMEFLRKCNKGEIRL